MQNNLEPKDSVSVRLTTPTFSVCKTEIIDCVDDVVVADAIRHCLAAVLDMASSEIVRLQYFLAAVVQEMLVRGTKSTLPGIHKAENNLFLAAGALIRAYNVLDADQVDQPNPTPEPAMLMRDARHIKIHNRETGDSDHGAAAEKGLDTTPAGG